MMVPWVDPDEAPDDDDDRAPASINKGPTPPGDARPPAYGDICIKTKTDPVSC